MHFTIADEVTGRGISFDTACLCDFDQCVYFVLNNQVMVLNISTTECFVSKNYW